MISKFLPNQDDLLSQMPPRWFQKLLAKHEETVKYFTILTTGYTTHSPVLYTIIGFLILPRSKMARKKFAQLSGLPATASTRLLSRQSCRGIWKSAIFCIQKILERTALHRQRSLTDLMGRRLYIKIYLLH
jgi:hypothetical protein